MSSEHDRLAETTGFIPQLPADHFIDGLSTTELAIRTELFLTSLGAANVRGWWLDPDRTEVANTNEPVQILSASLPADITGAFTLAFSLHVMGPPADMVSADVVPGTIVTVQPRSGSAHAPREPQMQLLISQRLTDFTPGEVYVHRKTLGYGPPSPGYSDHLTIGVPGRWVRIGLVMGRSEMKVFCDGRCASVNGVPARGFPLVSDLEVVFGLIAGSSGPRFRLGEVRMWDAAHDDEALRRDALRNGGAPEEYTEFGDRFTENVATGEWERAADPAIFLVENYRLSIVPAGAGLGKVAKTLTLLPGERVETAVSTRRTVTTSTADRTSVLDSMREEVAEEYQRDVQSEREVRDRTARSTSSRSATNYSVSASASASWGWGSARVSASVSGSREASRSASAVRDEMARSLNSVSARSAQRANAQRDLTVEIVNEVDDTIETLESVRRVFRNPSTNRTMTAVFRQVNQRYTSFLHLSNLQIGYADGITSRVISLEQLDELLDGVLVDGDEGDGAREAVRAVLREEFGDIDVPPIALGVRQVAAEGGPFLSEVDGGFIVNPLAQGVATLETGVTVALEGALVNIDSTVLMTDGVVAECALGQSEVFDLHAHDTRDELLVERRFSNRLLERRLALLESEDLPLGARVALLLALPGNDDAAIPDLDDGEVSGHGDESPGRRSRSRDGRTRD